MHVRSSVARGAAAALLGGLLALPSLAAGPKSGGIHLVVDDLIGASAGAVQAAGGNYTLDGAIAPVAASTAAMSISPFGVLEAGFFSALTTTPVTSSFLPVSTKTVSVQWSVVNPTGTLFTIETSTAADFTGTVFSSAVYNSTYAAIGGLKPFTTYHLRYKAEYMEGDETAYHPLGSTQTLSHLPPGCEDGFLVKQDGTEDFTSIQDAVDALPNPLTGHTCVVIEDFGIYNEQVVVANFLNNGSSITIRARLDSGVRPVVDPPFAATAGFLIQNASVNIAGIDVRVDDALPYGIYASSGWVTISSVAVSTIGAFGLTGAGIRISSWTTVSYASVTVGGAHGVWLDPTAKRSTIRFSSVTNAGAEQYALFFDAASTNTVLSVRAHNPLGEAVRLAGNFNTISFSSFTSDAAGAVGFHISGFDSNAITGSYIASSAGHALWLNTGSSNNQVSQSTIAGSVSYAALRLSGSSQNTFTQSLIAGGWNAVDMFASNNNIISQSTLTAGAGGAKALYLVQSSSNVISSVTASNAVGGAAALFSGSNYNQISVSSFSSANFVAALTIDASSANAISNIYATAASSHALMMMVGADRNTILGGTFVVSAMQPSAVYVNRGSSNTFIGLRAFNSMGYSGYFTSSATCNIIALSSFVSAGTQPALWFDNSSSNTLTGVYASNPGQTALSIQSSDWMYVAGSTFTGGFTGVPGVWLSNVSSSTVTGTIVVSSMGVRLSNSQYNTLSLSTFVASQVDERALQLEQSSWNTITSMHLAAPAGGRAAYFQMSSNNSISQSTMVAGGINFDTLQLNQSSSNTFTNTLIISTGQRAASFQSGSHNNQVLFSTIASRDNEGLRVDMSTGTRVADSYVQGSTGVYVLFSHDTFLHRSTFVALTGCSVFIRDSSVFNLSSSVVTSESDGVCVNNSNNGVQQVSSNVITARVYGVRVLSQNAGAQVRVSSNVILPLPGNADGGGIRIQNLTTGGTFYNNSIYYRTSGGVGGAVHAGIYANDSGGLSIERNRINMPNMLASGSFEAIKFVNSTFPGAVISHNDVHVVSLGGLNSVSLFRTDSALGGTMFLRNNIFSSSVTATSSYTIRMFGGGINSNYNVFHSSTGPLSFAAGFDVNGLPGWIAATSQDMASVNGHPQWASTALGFEDFHVKSTVGRYDPATQGFAPDAVDSASLDAADPTGPYAAEPAPNGFHANAGSTGGTSEASMSPPETCAVTRKVCKNGGCPFTSIQAAIDSIPNPLVGHSCVSIRDNGPYDIGGGLVVSGFTLMGSSLSLAADPALSTGALLQLGSAGAVAMLDIRVASVTVSGLTLEPGAHSTPYGVRVSSPNVVISSVNVVDLFSRITVAGIALSTESSLSYSTITVSNTNAAALISTGSWVLISHASMTWNGAGGTEPLFQMRDSTGSVLTDIKVQANGSMIAVRFTDVTDTTVTRATFTTVSGSYALSIATGANLSFSELVLTNVNSSALLIDSNSSGVSIDRSSITASAQSLSAVQLKGSGNVLSNTRIGVGTGGFAALEVRGFGIRLSTVIVEASAEAVTVFDSTGVVITNSRMHGGLFSTNGSGLYFNSGGGGHEVLDSTMTTNATAGSPRALAILNVSSNTIRRSYIANINNGEAFYLSQSTGNVISQSTITAGSGAGLSLVGASSNAITNLSLDTSNGSGIAFDANSNGNVVAQATIAARGFTSSGITFTTSSSNTITQAVILSTGYHGVSLSGGSNSNSIVRSSITSLGSGNAGYYSFGASSNTITESYVSAPSGRGVYLDNNSGFNTVSLSTVVNGAPGLPAFEIFNSTVNRIERSVILSTGGSSALRLQSSADFTVVDQSELRVIVAGGEALRIESSSAAVVSRSYLIAVSSAATIIGANNRVLMSTIAGGGYGIYLSGPDLELSGSYVEGSTAVYVTSSARPRVNGNRIAGVGAAGTGLYLTAGSTVTFSSNTFSGAGAGAGVSLGNTGGAIIFSTNTFLPGARYGFYTGDLLVDSSLWITSNTILPTIGGSTNTYGLYFDGLTRGATIQNNGIFYRATGAMAGANLVTYGLYAKNSPNLRIDHNRYGNPNTLTTGGAIAFAFDNADDVAFLYNDVYSAELVNPAPYLLSFGESSGARISGNIFTNYMQGASGNSAIFNVADATSQSGFASNYNDLHIAGSNPRVGYWNSPTPLTFATWKGTTLMDADSISADPLWFSTGTEDFHPLSAAANGRFDQATLSYTSDSVSSPTIDKGDPQDSRGAELAPGSSRVNQGSYAQTVEASRSAPPSGCFQEYTVGTGFNATIGDALAEVIAAGPLAGDTCIVVRKTPNNEPDIVVSGIATAGKRLIIMGEPGVPTVINSNGSVTAGFSIQNDSVTLKDLIITAGGGIVTAVDATAAAHVLITSVSLNTSFVTGWGVRLSSYSTVSYSSVSVNGSAIELRGAGASVLQSTAISLSPSNYGLHVNGASSAAVTGLYATGLATAVYVGGGAMGMSVTSSAFSASGTGAVFVVASASRGVITDTFLDAPNGSALRFEAGAYDNEVSFSTITSNEDNYPTIAFVGAASNTVTRSYVDNAATARTIRLTNGARLNTLSQMTLTGRSTARVVELVGASSNTLSQVTIESVNGEVLSFETGAHYNRIERSTVASYANAAQALFVDASSGTYVQDSYFYNGAGGGAYGLHLKAGANHTTVDLSTIISNGDPAAAYFVGDSSYTTLSRSQVRNLGNGAAVYLNNSHGGFIDRSTVTTSPTSSINSLLVSSGRDNRVSGSYVAGIQSVYVGGALRTMVDGNYLLSTNVSDPGLEMASGSNGLTVIGNIIVGARQGAGVRIAAGNTGSIIIATNTFPAVPQTARFGIFITTQAAGAKVYIASNTIVPATVLADAGGVTAGIYLDGLDTGATVYGNSIYYRTAGSMGGFPSYGIYATDTNSLLVDHNRISNPGMLTAGGYAGISLQNAPNTSILFNDVNSAVAPGGALTSAFGLVVTNSPGLRSMSNVFSSSLTVTASSATFSIDAPSAAGSDADYNIYFSSTSRNTLVDSAGAHEFPWGLSIDESSLAVNPHWPSVLPGAEDFHPLSHAGRFNPATGAHDLLDAWTSGSLDRADPAVSAALEPADNGGQANMGSYGATPEASITPAAPTAPAFVAVHASSVTVGYALAPGAPTYSVSASTASNFSAVVISSVSSNGSVTALTPGAGAPLSANATYYFVAAAHWGDAYVQAAPSLSTVTLTFIPSLPSAVSFPTVHHASATAAWQPNGNPLGVTTYTITFTTSANFPNADSGNVTVTTLTYSLTPDATAYLTGLTPNTTYFGFAAGLNHAGAVSAYLPLGSTATRANTPVFLGAAFTFSSVTDQTLNVAWDANGNPVSITSYTVEASTDAVFDVGEASLTVVVAPAGAPLAAFTGLTPAATYFLRVGALNGDGELTPYVLLGSTVMLPLQISPPVVQPVTTVATYSVTAAWGLVANATGYTLYASTMSTTPPVDVWATSSTFSQGATTATVFAPPLQPNTTYFLFVRAHGLTANSSYAAYAATATLAATPQSDVTTFTAVSITSFTVSWLSGGNPLAMTTYTVVASTAADFNLGAASVTFSTVPAAGPTATLTGLGAYTTYFVQVRALGQGVQATPFIVLGATQTLPIVLPTPVTGATGVSASSMSAAWSLVAGATGYTLAAALTNNNPPIGVVASSVVAGVDTTSASVFGLLPNTTHFLFIRADGPGSSSLFSLYAATATDPVAPSSAAATFSSVGVAVMTVNWEQGANPIGVTSYTVTLSTTPTFPNASAGNQSAPNVVPSAATPSQALAGLGPNTTYFAFVEARSNAGSRIGTMLGSTATLANIPTAPITTFTLVGATSVTINWQNGGNPTVTTYTVVASTASDFNAFASSVVLTTAPGAGLSATFTTLSFGTTWFFQVAAVNHNGVPSAFLVLGSTYTNLSNLIPQILDFQTGDDVWRRDETGGFYDIRFADASGSNLDKVQVRVSTMPGGADTDLIPFTDLITGMSPLDSYATPFQLTPALFNLLQESATNYVTVRIFNGVPSTNTIVDAFYVRKDTTPPSLVNGEAGGDPIVQIAPGRAYAVTTRDLASGLDAFQYSVSLTPGSGDGLVIPWTDIAPLSGATDYTTPWTVDFAQLQTGTTNYVSVRAVDLAGGTSTYLDAFRVLKDTVGPAVTISTPNAGTGFISGVPAVQGGASGVFGVQGSEVSVQINPPGGLYLNGFAGTFSSVGPVWLPATGVSSWTVSPGITFVNGTSYRVVARSSTTYNLYSTVFATAQFIVDNATPTVAVTSPPPLSTVSSLPLISGTAADPGGAPSGVAAVEVRLLRLSDGLWWNWVTDSWGALAVSSFSAGPAAWSVTPSALLQGSLVSGTSFYVAVRASDASLPANVGDFFAQGSTFTFSNAAPPDPISDLAGVNGPLPGEITLSWTARGPHGSTGTTLLGQYAIFTATYGAAPASTSAAIVFATSSVNGGDLQLRGVTGLTAGVTYFLSVAMANTDGTWSLFSNVASTTATPAPSDSILGHVVNASTQGITAVRVDAFDTSGLLVATAFTLADGSGTYTVNGLTSGNYKLEASWTANGITSSVWLDGIAMGSVNVDFSLDINYALATLTGTLGALTASGQAGLGVAGSGYRPSAEGSRIELFQSGREVSRVGVDPTGRWTIAHLLPGSYSVRAYTGLGYTDFVDVDLAEGEIRTVGFIFNPLPEASVYAFPNPARYSSTIRFETALQPLEAQIAIFDLKGALVREVPGNSITATATPGVYHYVWDLTNSRGSAVASGVYLFMVKVKGGSENQLVKVVKKLAVVR